LELIITVCHTTVTFYKEGSSISDILERSRISNEDVGHTHFLPTKNFSFVMRAVEVLN